MGALALSHENPPMNDQHGPVKRLLSASAAAAYLGIGRDRIRAIRRAGEGPRAWNPDGGRAMFAVSVLDEWLSERDDPEKGR